MSIREILFILRFDFFSFLSVPYEPCIFVLGICITYLDVLLVQPSSSFVLDLG